MARAGAQPQPNTGQLVPGLLPTRGINARDAFLQMGPEDAINLVNFLSDDAGLACCAGAIRSSQPGSRAG